MYIFKDSGNHSVNHATTGPQRSKEITCMLISNKIIVAIYTTLGSTSLQLIVVHTQTNVYFYCHWYFLISWIRYTFVSLKGFKAPGDLISYP